MKYTFTAVFHEENGKVYAKVPDLEGCITTGKDFSDAIDQMADAMAAWLCTAEDEDVDIPLQAPQNCIIHGDMDVLSLIKADTIKYRVQTSTKTVRKKRVAPRMAIHDCR